jgi:LuxR family transcriptional regulator, maltose regulon positive regulatory protein
VKDPGTTRHFLHEVDEFDVVPVTVTLLGAFSIGLAGKMAGPWPRPSAKRLCELLMLRSDHKLLKEVVREILFAQLPPEGSANALRKAMSMARQALLPLGEVGSRLLRADRDYLCVSADVPIEIDLVTHETALRSGLGMEPGSERDGTLSAALLQSAAVLDDEPYSYWVLEQRDALERLRQRARLRLARDRTNGHGRSQPDAVIDSWEACLAHDAASEEAAVNLMMCYAALGQRQLVVRTYRVCRQGLEDLDLNPSSALERAYQSATKDDMDWVAAWSWAATALGGKSYEGLVTGQARTDAEISKRWTVAS